VWNKVHVLNQETPPPSVSGNELLITFINHSTFLIQVNGLNILTDPVWSKRCSPFQWAGPKRFHEPGVALSDLPKIDLILLSHNHYDHLDITTFKKLYTQHQPKVIVPLGVDLYLEKKGITSSHVMDWYDRVEIQNGVEVMSTPAQHFSSRGMFDRDRTLWCGYGIKIQDEWIWFAGDSGYGPFFKEIGQELKPLRTAIIPIGAYKPRWFMQPIHLSPEEALQVHEDVGSPYSIACHFGTFPLAKDGMDEPTNELIKCLSDPDQESVSFRIPVPGKPILVPQAVRNDQSTSCQSSTSLPSGSITHANNP
jgi:L-ascorbate metabolism protein UlaG (beta-lactamase superfamily)